MQSVMYELMSELNDRSEDLERQMLSLEQRMEQLTAGFNSLPAHLSATLSAQHAALIHLLQERDARDGRAMPPLPSGASLTAAAAASAAPAQLASPAQSPPQVPTLALESPLSSPPLSPQGSPEAGSNFNACVSNC